MGQKDGGVVPGRARRIRYIIQRENTGLAPTAGPRPQKERNQAVWPPHVWPARSTLEAEGLSLLSSARAAAAHPSGGVCLGSGGWGLGWWVGLFHGFRRPAAQRASAPGLIVDDR